jgi:hypothetical protein
LTGAGYYSSHWHDGSPFCLITRTSSNCNWEWLSSIIHSSSLTSTSLETEFICLSIFATFFTFRSRFACKLPFINHNGIIN